MTRVDDTFKGGMVRVLDDDGHEVSTVAGGSVMIHWSGHPTESSASPRECPTRRGADHPRPLSPNRRVGDNVRTVRPGFPESGGDADRFIDIDRRLRALESASRLTRASIGSGGITVKDGGKITFLDSNGNELATLDENGIVVTGAPVQGIWPFESETLVSNDETITDDPLQLVQTVTIDPPSWVDILTVVGFASFQGLGPNNLTVNLNVDDGGAAEYSPGTATETAGSGETGHVVLPVGVTIPLDPAGRTVDVSHYARVSMSDSTTNRLLLSVAAFGLKASA